MFKAVEPVTAGQAPGGARGIELPIGAPIERFALRPDVLHSMVSDGRSWAARQRECSVKVTPDRDSLKISGPHPAEQDRLLDLWIAHGWG